MDAYTVNNHYQNIGVNTSLQADSRQQQLTTVLDVVTDYQYGIERLANSSSGLSNPSFLLTSSNNKLIDSQNNKILRGYIRRSGVDFSDPTSRYRLYFMFNPAEIQRNYMAYLDQQALDPYNNLFGSSNLSAPPGILDFSFDLLFDRQLEVARDPLHMGTKVDYDFFDIVVRGVVPDINNEGNAIPDNGIMMTNPRNVAVVFSGDLAVHGRPYNSSIRFERFSHKMTPTRMVISITLKAFYVGPVQTIPNYNQFTSESVFSATIPYDESVKYQASYTTVDSAPLVDNPADTQSSNYPSPYTASPSTSTPPTDGLYQTKGIILTEDQMADLVVGSGMRGDAAAIAIAIAYRESEFNSGAYNLLGLDHKVGLFKFNMHPLAYGSSLGTMDQLMVPAYAMQKFIEKSENGTNFSPWYITPAGLPVRDGYDLKFLPRAKQLVQERGGY